MNRQTAKTRAAISQAFNGLVFSRRYDEIRMTDIASAADVGRSTLYQHYPDKDSILIANMNWVLHGLLQATRGPAGHAVVLEVLDHIWDHRAQARHILFGATGEKLESALADAVFRTNGTTAADEIPAIFTANQVAAVVFSSLRSWLRAEASCPPSDLAQNLCRISAALTGTR